jgi:hypothetical protein
MTDPYGHILGFLDRTVHCCMVQNAGGIMNEEATCCVSSLLCCHGIDNSVSPCGHMLYANYSMFVMFLE